MKMKFMKMKSMTVVFAVLLPLAAAAKPTTPRVHAAAQHTKAPVIHPKPPAPHK